MNKNSDPIERNWVKIISLIAVLSLAFNAILFINRGDVFPSKKEFYTLSLQLPRPPLQRAYAERAMRPIAVGRKNWMFAGSDNGGHTAAGIYSLIETAKMNNINPFLYLQKVLNTIQDHNSNRLADLLPWNITL